MKRLKSTLATILLVSAGAAAIGLGTMMAVAALFIGLVIAGAAKLAISAQGKGAAERNEAAEADIAGRGIATAR